MPCSRSASCARSSERGGRADNAFADGGGRASSVCARIAVRRVGRRRTARADARRRIEPATSDNPTHGSAANGTRCTRVFRAAACEGTHERTRAAGLRRAKLRPAALKREPFETKPAERTQDADTKCGPSPGEAAARRAKAPTGRDEACGAHAGCGREMRASASGRLRPAALKRAMRIRFRGCPKTNARRS